MFLFGCIKESLWVGFFNDFIVGYKDYMICNLMGKVYFMGDIDYGYVFFGKFDYCV